MSHFLFFSYATGDDPEVTQHKRQFFDDLIAQVSKHREFNLAANPDPGFLDAEMRIGTEWEPMLAQALRTCKVFVYLQEPAYFDFKLRPWCGREWHVFRSRLKKLAATLEPTAECPPLMIPIVWRSMARVPDAAGALQFQHRQLGDVYERLGVYSIKSRPENNGAYTDLLVRLADHIVKTASIHDLPPSLDLPSFQDIHDPFSTHGRAQARGGSRVEGPRCVDFVYIVGKKAELRNVRSALDGYDDGDDARRWKPYFPSADDHIAKIAEMLAHKKDRIPNRITFGPDLIDRLQEARTSQRIVVLIADPWTLQIPEYNSVMAKYRDTNFWNCAVVIPWNEDHETRQQAAMLEEVVNHLFSGLPKEVVRSQTRTSRELIKHLEKAFISTHKKIEEYAKFRVVNGTGPRHAPGFSGV